MISEITPESLVISKQFNKILRFELQTLKPMDRFCLLECCVWNRTLTDVGKELNRSRTNVARCRDRAIVHMRRLLFKKYRMLSLHTIFRLYRREN